MCSPPLLNLLQRLFGPKCLNTLTNVTVFASAIKYPTVGFLHYPAWSRRSDWIHFPWWQCRRGNRTHGTCKRRQEASCPICKQLIALCCHHAKVCTKPNCTVPFCPNIRQKLQEQRQLQNRRAEMMMRRRMKLVQSDSPPQQFSQKCDS